MKKPCPAMAGSLTALVLITCYLTPFGASADEGKTSSKAIPSAQIPAPIPSLPTPVIELSFGHSQLFAESTVERIQDVGPGGVIPTSSALFIAEWLVSERWGVLGIFNLPLTTQQTVEDGEVFEERVSPSAGVGGRFSLLRFDLRPRAVVEIQTTLLVGRTIGSLEGDIFFPLLGGRFHVSRPMGFGMYAGLTWAFQKETLALFYGVSHRF